jgi:hypothetical protein
MLRSHGSSFCGGPSRLRPHVAQGLYLWRLGRSQPARRSGELKPASRTLFHSAPLTDLIIIFSAAVPDWLVDAARPLDLLHLLHVKYVLHGERTMSPPPCRRLQHGADHEGISPHLLCAIQRLCESNVHIMRLPFRRRPGSSSRPSSRPSFQQRLARKSGDQRDRVQPRAIRSARRGWDTTCRRRERDSGDYIPSIGADSSIRPRQCLPRSSEERFPLAADGTHRLAIMRVFLNFISLPLSLW